MTCLQEAGVDTDTFKVHSVRGAACSTAAWSGVTTTDIINAADWSSEGTFQQFYHKEIRDGAIFETTVLSSANTSNLHVDMENGVFWNGICKWLRAQSVCMLFVIT